MLAENDKLNLRLTRSSTRAAARAIYSQKQILLFMIYCVISVVKRMRRRRNVII